MSDFVGRYFWFFLIGSLAYQYQRGKRNSSLLALDAIKISKINFYRNIWFGTQFILWLIVGYGILSGNLKDIFGIFQIRDGNPFSLAFLLISAAMAWGAAWWIFSGGAKEIVDLQLMEQLGYRGASYTERGIKIFAGIGVLAPIFLVVGCLSINNGSAPLFSSASISPLPVSADGYRVVYDFSQSGLSNWWFPAFGMIFVAVGGFLVYFRKDLTVRGPAFMRKAFPYIFLGFAIFWTVSATAVIFSQYRQAVTSIANGRTQIVEGEVSDYVPRAGGRGSMEHFCVQHVCFSYSDFVVGVGFSNTASLGGPIHEGLPVRVTYIGNEIVKLETRPNRSNDSASVEDHAAMQDNSISSMKETPENITAAAGIHVNPDDCNSTDKVVSSSAQIIRRYECPVPESSRLRLRSEFLKQGWENERIVDEALSKFRKSDQTAAIYCAFKAATCTLRFEYSAKRD